MNEELPEQLLHKGLGFDYASAVTELLAKFTYREIGDRMGYRSIGSVSAILDGKVPSHMHGEALWLLYKETFGKRPPLTDMQKKANSLTE